ncbi:MULTISPECIES: FAD-dependent monooxygenase [unclassified Nocardia]|uniref:FAD-dependent monooxygenase n=1 Tax=unclassified Nocardia TaxID=2637762 RepID=UPI001CE45A14|nr:MULTISPECIES: FAD-dependent monooxygenase [unclassified Nocardia]
MSEKTVLISGASVAGPALAYWLHRYGFTVTVVEQAPGPRDGGYKVDVRGVAMELLRRMGCADAVAAASTGIRGGQWIAGTGEPLATLGPDLIGLRAPGDDEMLRGDLARILYDATRADVEYLFGDSITRLTERADGVEVTFRHRTPRVFDLVIGADGLHSGVRGQIFGPETEFVRHTGMMACVYTIPNFFDLDHWELLYPTPGHVVQVYSTHPSEAKVQFIFPAPPDLPDRRDIAAQQRLVRTAFADGGWETRKLLSAMADSPDFYFDSVSQVRLEQWWRGRVALVGDAAYCPSPLAGQGTSMALVGAYVLAGELKSAAGEHRIAFPNYQRTVGAYIDQNLTLGWTNATRMVACTPRDIRMQTAMFRMLRRMPWKGLALRPIMKPINRAANAIALADY